MDESNSFPLEPVESSSVFSLAGTAPTQTVLQENTGVLASSFDPEDGLGVGDNSDDETEEEDDNAEPELLNERELVATIQELFGVTYSQAQDLHDAFCHFASLQLDLVEWRTEDLYQECDA